MNQDLTQTERYAFLAELAKALGQEHRLQLLDHIAQGERSVERLAELCDLSIANTSQHLQQLRRAGLVLSRRDGKRALYRIGDGPILAVLAALRQLSDFTLLARVQLVRDSLDQPESLQAVSRAELLRMIEDDSVTLLDVRPQEEYNLGHLPRAKSIPVEELADRLNELDPARMIVAYCRGPYCVMSQQAGNMLKNKGFQVRRFAAGVPEWRALGLPVDA